METPEMAASFSWDQPNSARAALIWAIDTFGIDTLLAIVDTFRIKACGGQKCHRFLPAM
jgi:hypothetical protein